MAKGLVSPARGALLVTALLMAAGCSEPETGPVRVSGIGAPPEMVNPNLRPLDPPSAFLLKAVAQGLVRFDAAGEIEPALAQSWIVSDDGLRYIFRLAPATWSDGSRVTAEQVAARLRASFSRASRSPLKPVLGAIAEVEAMTDRVLEISLYGPRPNLLQLLAQPEMAIIVNGRGTGPYRIAGREQGLVRLSIPRADDEEESEDEPAGPPDIWLRAEPAALAIARFAANETDLVVGGTIGNLALAQAADLPNERLVFDPAAGLFGLVFDRAEGALADAAVRRALSMAVDRESIVSAFQVPGLQPRVALVPMAGDEVPQPLTPDWATDPMPMRRELASRTLNELAEPLRIRVKLPQGPGYRLLFAHLRRDWRLVGVEAVMAAPDEEADLVLIDELAPGSLPTWYLRHFTCDQSPVCDPGADEALEAARNAGDPALRRGQLATADQLLSALTPFIPLTAPVRWSLVSARLTGFRPNPFARHPAATLITED